jgi:hypothetical protein
MNEQIYLDYARFRLEAREAQAQAQPAFYCDRSALDRAERSRHAEVTRELLALAGPPRELPDGLVFELGNEMASLELAAEFVARERRCCPFLEFRIDAGTAPARLSITGPAGVKPFLRAELGLA